MLIVTGKPKEWLFGSWQNEILSMSFFIFTSSFKSILKAKDLVFCYIALLITRWDLICCCILESPLSRNQSWKMDSQILEYSAGNNRQQKQTLKAFQLITNKFSRPESTVKTAAKALSLRPSMTLLEWTSSKHMRLKPTTSRTMYNISETSDSHSIPAKQHWIKSTETHMKCYSS